MLFLVWKGYQSHDWFLLAAGFIQHQLHAKALCVPRLWHLTLYRRSCPALHAGRVTVERDKCGHLCSRGEAGRHPETVKDQEARSTSVDNVTQGRDLWQRWSHSALGRGHSRCKGLGTGLGLVLGRDSEEARVAGAE